MFLSLTRTASCVRPTRRCSIGSHRVAPSDPKNGAMLNSRKRRQITGQDHRSALLAAHPSSRSCFWVWRQIGDNYRSFQSSTSQLHRRPAQGYTVAENTKCWVLDTSELSSPVSLFGKQFLNDDRPFQQTLFKCVFRKRFECFFIFL